MLGRIAKTSTNHREVLSTNKTSYGRVCAVRPGCRQSPWLILSPAVGAGEVTNCSRYGIPGTFTQGSGCNVGHLENGAFGNETTQLRRGSYRYSRLTPLCTSSA